MNVAVNRITWESDKVAIAEGFCPFCRTPLEVVELHGRETGACRACGCNWYTEDGVPWGSGCAPGNHTCGWDVVSR